MGFLGIGKKDNFVDLTEKYKKQQKKVNEIRNESNEEEVGDKIPTASPGIFGMFGGGSQTNDADTKESTSQDNSIEKRRKLAKRLMDMTDKIEDLSNKIYHLEQRIEILEKKSQN